MSLEAMMAATQSLPAHLTAGLEAGQGLDLPEGPFDAALCVGMGGSSIGGTLAAGLLMDESDVPIHVCRSHSPPGFVDERTLVVATSYSGNTAETLDATRACLERGASLVAITTGGELGALAADHGAPVLEVPSGFQPRAAAGWLFAPNYTVLSRVLGIGDPGALEEVAASLSDGMDELAAPDGPADSLAGQLADHPVGVVGHDLMGVVARRWAGEISENGKRVAFHAVLPEMAHNQLVGWDGEPAGTALVLLRREDEGRLEKARFDFLSERASKAGATVLEARVGGPGGQLREVLEGVVLGDLVSLHMARRKGIDPEPVDVITALKKRLTDAADEE